MNWWEGVNDVTEEDVFSIIRLYNDFVRVFEGGFKYHIKVTKNFFKHKHYGDAIALFRLIEGLDTKPRIYLSAQFNLYRKMKKHPYSRPIPTLKNLSSPSAVKRWNKYLLDSGQKEMPCVKLSAEDILKYNEHQLKSLMSSWNITDEESFYKDIVLANQFSIDFLETRSIFQGLVAKHYYESTFNVENYRELFGA